MLAIRREQLAAFANAAVNDFLDRIVAYLGTHFPERCRAIGAVELRGLSRDGIARARRHGITSERDVCKYIALSVVFGRDFDTRLPWAADILAAQPDGSARLRALYRAARTQPGDV